MMHTALATAAQQMPVSIETADEITRMAEVLPAFTLGLCRSTSTAVGVSVGLWAPCCALQAMASEYRTALKQGPTVQVACRRAHGPRGG